MGFEEPELGVDAAGDFGEEIGGVGVAGFVGFVDGFAQFVAVFGEAVDQGGEVVGDGVDIGGVRWELGVFGDDLRGAEGGAAELGNAFGHFVVPLVLFVTEAVEHFVDADELGAFEVPVGLLGGEGEVDAVGEAGVEQGDGDRLGVVGEGVAGAVGAVAGVFGGVLGQVGYPFGQDCAMRTRVSGLRSRSRDRRGGAVISRRSALEERAQGSGACSMLKNRVAIVTGSTSGIGLGIAQSLAAQGAAIMLNGFGEAAAIEKVRADLAAAHGVAVGYSGADMSKPDEIAGMVKAAEEQLGGVHILVNNAGIQFTAPIESFPVEKWDQIIAINLSAAFHAMAAAIPVMKKAGWGRIINIASAHGLVASPHKAAYVAAKHGLVGLTKVAGIELANDGITCNAICPGWVLTPLVEKQIADRAKAEGRSEQDVRHELLAEKQPMLEFSTPAQMGALAVFLCSDDAKTITGVPLSIDGGWTAG